MNKSLKDVAYGKFKVMVEAKSKTVGNEVHLVKSNHNSQTCSHCGQVSKDNRKTQAGFKCLNCGLSLNADINAAINIRNRAEWEKDYAIHPGRAILPESTPVSLGELEGKPSKSLPLSSVPLDNVESQQEGELPPLPEITGNPNPERGKTGKRKQGQKDPTPRQNAETTIQLDLWQ